MALTCVSASLSHKPSQRQKDDG